jgi:hypothetical protein
MWDFSILLNLKMGCDPLKRSFTKNEIKIHQEKVGGKSWVPPHLDFVILHVIKK